MDETLAIPEIESRIARRLKEMRSARGWSLEELAQRSTVSRATLSRLENAEVSATASVLNRICSAFEITLSRLMMMVEDSYPAVVRGSEQLSWHDRAHGFVRKTVSPPAGQLSGEVLECRIAAGKRIAYDVPPRIGLEHHLLLVEGALIVTVGGARHELKAGDALRYRLVGESVFETPETADARYFLFLV